MNSLPEKNRVRWACRRGMLELDFIFQYFFEHHYDALSEVKKIAFVRLLKQDDPSLYDWLISEMVCTDAELQTIIAEIKNTSGTRMMKQ